MADMQVDLNWNGEPHDFFSKIEWPAKVNDASPFDMREVAKLALVREWKERYGETPYKLIYSVSIDTADNPA